MVALDIRAVLNRPLLSRSQDRGRREDAPIRARVLPEAGLSKSVLSVPTLYLAGFPVARMET